MLIKWDGHTHTNFCRHGSNADMELYIKQAIKSGFQRYTISEHPPLPEAYLSGPQIMEQLAMKADELPIYMNRAHMVKERYRDEIQVMVGLELDYLPNEYDFTLQIVDQWDKQLEDVIVSVHYMQGVDGMRCIDYTPQDFADGLLRYYGSMAAVIEEYYNQVENAIEWASQLPMRKRIGHINLIEKFRLALPDMDQSQMANRLNAILPKLKACGMGVDANTAGFRNPRCGRAYVPEWFLHKCIEMDVPVVFGSDAHSPDDVGDEWDWFEQTMSRKVSKG